MSEKQKLFYAVSYGKERGIYETYKEAQRAMKGFPESMYKKFGKREEAEEYLKKSQPESTSYEASENDTDGKFYAVARGRIIGIFKDLETVKKNTVGFPHPKHKKFSTFAEAKGFVEKYAEGKVDEKKTPKKRVHPADEDGNDAQGVKAVARKRTSGKVGETDESDGGEHMDQTHSSAETNDTIDETIHDEEVDSPIKEVNKEEVQVPKVAENGDQKVGETETDEEVKGTKETEDMETKGKEDISKETESTVEPAIPMEGQ